MQKVSGVRWIKQLLSDSIHLLEQTLNTEQTPLELDGWTQPLIQTYYQQNQMDLIGHVEEDDILDGLIEKYLRNPVLHVETHQREQQIRHSLEDYAYYVSHLWKRYLQGLDYFIQSNSPQEVKSLIHQMQEVLKQIPDFLDSNKTLEEALMDLFGQILHSHSITLKLANFASLSVIGQHSILEKKITNDIIKFAQEILWNVMTHGKARIVFLVINQNVLKIVDDGIFFDYMNEFPKVQKKRGGAYTFQYVRNHYSNLLEINHYHTNAFNTLSIHFVKQAFQVNQELVIDIDPKSFRKEEVTLSVSKKKGSILFWSPSALLCVSIIDSAIRQIRDITPVDQQLVVSLDDDISASFFQDAWDDPSVVFKKKSES